MPKRRAGGVGVEGVHAVVLGDDIDDVVRALARDSHLGLDERLPVDQSVNRILEELAERRFDVGGREDLFGQILAGTLDIIVIGQHVGGDDSACGCGGRRDRGSS